jgi:hypothetical protein
MRTVKMTAMFVLGAAVALSPALTAQKTTEIHPGRGGSPHVKTEWTIDGANITIEYGRPLLKGREEATLMPPGKPWRTGADEATMLTTDRALTFGTLKLEPGTYTLNTIPDHSGRRRVDAARWPARAADREAAAAVGDPLPAGARDR